MAKPEGIRKVLTEQGLEGAVIYLAEQIEALREQQQQKEPEAPVFSVAAPKVEG